MLNKLNKDFEFVLRRFQIEACAEQRQQSAPASEQQASRSTGKLAGHAAGGPR